VVQDEIEKVDRVLADKNAEVRARLVRMKTELDQELATCEAELMERHLASASQKRRLAAVEQLLQAPDKAPEDRRAQDTPKAPGLSNAVQVRIAEPPGMKVWVADAKGQFAREPDFEAPGRVNLQSGHTYRLKIAELPHRRGTVLYPTLELPQAQDARAQDFLSNTAIPLTITEEDLDRVASGTAMVMKVVHLQGPKKGEEDLEAGDVGVVMSYKTIGEDAVAEAKRRGPILAILRLGNIDLEGRPGGRIPPPPQ
jgi:hypothetical protein